MKTYFSNPATADELMLANIPDVLQRAGVSAKSCGESLEREAFNELGHATWSFMAKPRKQSTTRRATRDSPSLAR